MEHNRKWFDVPWEMTKIFVGTFFYNNFCNYDYIVDILMSPLYWFTDNYVSSLGSSFVTLCSFCMLSVICISYWIGLPYWWNKSSTFTIVLLIIGNWLMVNTIFHFYMGVNVDPGHPLQKNWIKEASSVCKKCIAPKPQRTHHCSVCRTCVLLMDHHCPWLNNCVGHYNRRYFFLYMVYIVSGVTFLMIFGAEIAYQEVWMTPPELDGVSITTTNATNHNVTSMKLPDATKSPVNLLYKSSISIVSIRRRSIIFAALLCVGVFIGLGLLAIRHIRLISNGETTIEMYINLSEIKRYRKMKKVYVNPYNYGKYKNWTLFLGIYNGSGRTWKHILLPSAHKPFGDGFVWPHVNSLPLEWEEFFHWKHL